MHSPWSIGFVALASALLLAGCGGSSPPSDRVKAEIARSILDSNSAMFDGGSGGAEVVDVEITGWTEQEDRTAGVPPRHLAEWKANLRFTESLACILAQVDGTHIVKVVAEKGEALPFVGNVSAMDWDGEWQVNASVLDGGDFTGPGAWKPIADRAPGLTMGYPVFQQGTRGNPAFRTRNFEPVSKLRPCVVEGSPEHQKIEAEAQQRWQKDQEAAAEQARGRQQALEEQRRTAQDQAAELQRQREAEQARLQAEAAERARIAAEEAKQKAADDLHARLLTVLEPFRSPAGAVIAAEAGASLGTVLLDAAIDDPKLSVSGRAVDLREMPFKEFTYDGTVDARGAFALKSSLGGDPVTYGTSGPKLASRAGFTISALSAAERENLEPLLALGKRLGGAPPVTLQVETLDAEAAKVREPELKLTGLSGTVFYRNRANPSVAPLFAADLGANKAYAWRNTEVVSIRLDEPVKGSGLYLRGTGAPSTELVVTINGVHPATVASIPKLGGVLVPLPADLEVLDVRLEAKGAVSMRTIGLVK